MALGFKLPPRTAAFQISSILKCIHRRQYSDLLEAGWLGFESHRGREVLFSANPSRFALGTIRATA